VVLGAPAAASSRDFNNPASHDTSQQFAYGAPLGPGNVQRQDTPNDPNYDNSEPDTLNGRTSSNLYDEPFYLFGFPSQLSPGAIYRDGPNLGKPQISGFNAAGAWKLERGRADVVVAILDTGIKWNELGLRLQVHLNTGELPYPELANGQSCGRYDCNGDNEVNVEDYVHDPRVSLSYPGRTSPPGLITGQDLLHAFGDCQIRNHLLVKCTPGHHWDNDHNGYANDIVGWNFFDNTNDPTDRSSYFSAANHGSGRALDATERGNDGQGSIGVCPYCQVMPIRIWDTFVSDADDFALGMTYATDNGVAVIEGANGSLYHSAFAEAASQYAYDHGVVQTYSGDDLNTANHNYPANYGHAMLIQGTVPDTLGEVPTGFNASPLASLPIPIGTQLPPQTYFRGANVTQYGGHSSIAMEGASGSENTSKAAGAAALVIAAGRDHGISLSPDETREILEQTAERVTTGDEQGLGTGDLAAPAGAPPDLQWTEHFGWGRPNLGAAVSVAASGKIPPIAAIDSPDWYAPLVGSSVAVRGLASAPRAPGGAFHYKLMWAPGLQPDPGSWNVVSEGDASGRLTSLGTISLPAVRAALASYHPPSDPGAPTFSPYAPNPFASQWTVQLEVSAPGVPTLGIDRRVFTSAADPSLVSGYPKRLGSGGEAPVRYAALTASNVQELLVPTEDGRVHAYLPSGRELRGWPVRTLPVRTGRGHSRSPALRHLGVPLEPPRAPVVADLRGDGQPDVITAAGVHVYAWDARGRRLRGFPVSEKFRFCRPSLESQPLHHPKCGFLASPAVGFLQGRRRGLDIIEPSLDGHLYAWNPRGRLLRGYPMALIDPSMPVSQRDVAESINDPAIGDLTGAGHDDIVVGTNEEYPASNAAPPVSGGLAGLQGTLLSPASGGSARVYAIDGATGKIMRGWPIAINGALQSELPLVGPGNDAEIARVGGREVVMASATGGALSEYGADGSLIRTIQQTAFGTSSDATDKSDVANLFESAAVGAVDGQLAVVKYGLSLGQVINLALPGQNVPYNHLIGAYSAASGDPLPAWPTITDDYQFLSSSTIARVASGAGGDQVLAGTGLGLLHAYAGASGRDVAGFPKVTGGWLFSPPAISSRGVIADVTREGYLFEWRVPGAAACQSEWPTFRHDPRDSGNYNADLGPPAAPTHASLRRLGGGRVRLTFISPGDHGMCGVPRAYVVRRGRRVLRASLGRPAAAGRRVRVALRLAGPLRGLSLQARDSFGNLGVPTPVR
jgi:Subtilase family